MFCWLPSLKVPVAKNCWLWPIKSEPLAGLTEIAVRAGGGRTFSGVEPRIELSMARIIVDPTEMLVATPVGATVLTEVLEEDQVTVPVRFC